MTPLVRLSLISLSVAFSAPRALGAPPSGVEAIAVDATHVRVYWNSAPGAEGYRIYRDGAPLGDAPADATSFQDSACTPGGTYRYEVAALKAGSEERGRVYVERSMLEPPSHSRCEVLVVGATTGGVAAAVTAARYGLNVVLTEETRRLGGMPVNGLGSTDLRRLANSSGFFEEFRRKIVALYGGGDGLRYEPRVAHQAMKELVWSAPGLTVYRGWRPVKVEQRGGRIRAVQFERTEGGGRAVIEPALVIDATDTGDVAAWAGAPFRLGREARSAREPHAGHIYYDRAGDKPLPGSTGKADGRLQSYAYLMTVKDFGPGADKTIPMPPGYDARNYEHVNPWEKAWAYSSGKLPNGKFEVNEHPQGTDLQGVNYRYPVASYTERRRIEALYKNHALGYLYYLQTALGKKNIGLSDDDYRDSGDWPTLLYIREARRFEADTLLDETEISEARARIRPTAIGIGDYPMDSHAVEPKTDWSTPDMGEGEFYLPQYTPWHQVPYEIMVPKKVDNLFVPTAVSATHVAYGTVRLEPVRMHLGEAAGIASVFCVRYGLIPREVPARQIQTELLKRRTPEEGRNALPGIGAPGPSGDPAYLYRFTDVTPDTNKQVAIQWLAARGFYPTSPPAQRTAASVLTMAEFAPNAPASEEEAVRLLALLSERARVLEPAAYVGLAGGAPRYHAPAVQSAVLLTRSRAAELLCGFMGWAGAPEAARYADLPAGTAETAAAEALRAHWIDSLLWDGMAAMQPDGRLIFRPDQPLTRAQLAQLIYLAHFHIGSTWKDL